MKTVVSLFERPRDATRAAQRLPLLAIDDNRIFILRSPAMVRQLLDCSQRRPVLRSALIGALAMLPLVGLCAYGDAHVAIGLGADPAWVIGEAIAFTLLGSACGAFMGGLAGRSSVEEETHLYLEGVRHGYVVVAVQVDDHLAEKAMNILRQQKGLGVKVCQRVRRGAAPESVARSTAPQPASGALAFLEPTPGPDKAG